MPVYRDLNPANEPADARTIERIQRLREEFATQQLPSRSLDQTLLLATWNIREFDSNNYDYRLSESVYYIAEIISRFDLVAVEEVDRNLAALKLLMWILGPDWKYLVTDVTAGTAGHNERTAILYDSRVVQFEGLAGELVIPPGDDVVQPVRSPIIAGFRVGWAVFSLAVVHLLWGVAKPGIPERVAEVDHIAGLLKAASTSAAKRRKQAETEGLPWEDRWAENTILVGDFNVFGPDDETLAALKRHGFTCPVPLEDVLWSNVNKDRPYDQIALRTRPDRFGKVVSGGAFDWTAAVFTDEDEAVYRSAMGAGYRKKKNGTNRTAREKHNYYKQWRTHQISDHLPLWVEIKVDYSDEYLARRLSEAVQP